jgi:hypothetical protein
MSETTQTVRDQAFLPLFSDIPDGVTLAQYRAGRTRPRARPRRRRLRLRLRIAAASR